MQILERIGPTVSLKSGDLNFGLRMLGGYICPHLVLHFGGFQTTFTLCNFFIGGHLNPFLAIFHFEHKMGTPSGHPHKKIDLF